MSVIVPHYAMPFQITPDGAKATEQDSLEEVRDCVANICAYRTGDRPEKPGFGIPDQTFSLNGPDTQLLVSTIAAQEPRAQLAATADPSNLEQLIATVDLTAAINVNVDLKGEG